MSASILARTDNRGNPSSRLVIRTRTRSPKLSSGGAPGVESVKWSFRLGFLTFDINVGTRAGTYRNQTLDNNRKLLVLLIFYELKWRRESPRNLCSVPFSFVYN